MHELLVDNFAGGGGASTGIEAALGRPVDIAINHDPAAIAMHKVNHPGTTHLCESVWNINPVEACGGRPVGLAWFSPDCTHFSKAKGGKPVKKKIRGLAWVVLRWAATVRPRVIMLENVEEFVTWGPLVKKEDGNHYPCPKQKGRTFRTFVNALKRHGYAVEFKTLRACDYGAPTIRKRLFMVARCDGQPIIWPEPTHGDPKSDAVKSGRLKPWRTAAECIDWSIPCPSIFERKKPLAEATLRRIAKGIMKYVVNSPDPFIVTYYGDKGGEFRGQDLGEPLRTQTTENRHGLVMPFITEHANASSQRNFPADDPLRTQCAQVKGGHFALVSPFLARTDMHKSNAGCHYPPEDPIRTITSTGGHALVAPTLIQTGYGEREGQSPRVPGLDKPLGTVVAGGSRHAVVSAFLAKHYSGVVGSEAEKPLGTVTSVDHHSLVATNLISHFGTGAGISVEKPSPAVMGKDKYSLVTSHMVKLKGDNIGHDACEPLHTVTAGGTHFGEVRAFLMKYYGNEKNGVSLTEPMHTVVSRDRFGLVTVQGQEYQIADIGMRMLTPRELFRAQGFPDTYIIECDENGKPFTKTEQVAKCGNSVPPAFSEALVKANYAGKLGKHASHGRVAARKERRAQC